MRRFIALLFPLYRASFSRGSIGLSGWFRKMRDGFTSWPAIED